VPAPRFGGFPPERQGVGRECAAILWQARPRACSPRGKPYIIIELQYGLSILCAARSAAPARKDGACALSCAWQPQSALSFDEANTRLLTVDGTCRLFYKTRVCAGTSTVWSCFTQVLCSSSAILPVALRLGSPRHQRRSATAVACTRPQAATTEAQARHSCTDTALCSLTRRRAAQPRQLRGVHRAAQPARPDHGPGPAQRRPPHARLLHRQRQEDQRHLHLLRVAAVQAQP